jgi:hypothetical protein
MATGSWTDDWRNIAISLNDWILSNNPLSSSERMAGFSRLAAPLQANDVFCSAVLVEPAQRFAKDPVCDLSHVPDASLPNLTLF